LLTGKRENILNQKNQIFMRWKNYIAEEALQPVTGSNIMDRI